MIHMKYQDLFSLKKKKKIRMLSATNFAWQSVNIFCYFSENHEQYHVPEIIQDSVLGA